MSEKLKEVMTQVLGENGISFIEDKEMPEIPITEKIGKIQDMIGNFLYAVQLAGIDSGEIPRPRQIDDVVDSSTENLIVPGYASKNSNFSLLRRELARNGVGSRAIRMYDDVRLINPLSAVVSAEYVEKAIVQSRADKINLVCHSLGGIITLIACQNLSEETRQKIGKVVSLGTPWKGAPLAGVFSVLKIGDKALKDLAPRSELITELLPKIDDEIKAKTVSIGSANDMIVPWEQTILEGSSVNAVLRRERAVTHANYLHDKYVAEVVSRILMD